MDTNELIKGGQLAGKRKLVMGVVAVVGLIGAYLVGDASLIDVAQRLAMLLMGS